MAAYFKIDVEPRVGLMTITLSGFFLPEDAVQYAAARYEAQRKLGTAPNQHLTLVDIREMKVQMQKSVELFRNTIADPAARSRRLAFVTPVGLAKMQATRATEGRGAEFFTSIKEARTWLLRDVDPPYKPLAN